MSDRPVKILILKPSSLGDVVQALPVLRLLKQYWPASQIYWWVEAALGPLLEGDPDLAGVVLFQRQRWASPANWPELWRSIRWLRAQRFDYVIDLQSLARSGAFAWLANGKLTIGLDEPREGARGFYDLLVRRPSFHTHAVDWYLGVLPLLGLPEANADPQSLPGTGSVNGQPRAQALTLLKDSAWLPQRPGVIAELRRKWAIEGTEWVLLQPGARWATKRWPAEYFAKLVTRLAAGLPHSRFAVLGSQADKSLGELIAQAAPTRCLDLTGKLSLPELIEWIRLGRLMVTNDTGPMHIAAALNKPVVALFGPTEPRRTGPYGQLEHVLQIHLPCEPCLSARCHYAQPLECLRAISPDVVAETVRRRLTSLAAHTAF